MTGPVATEALVEALARMIHPSLYPGGNTGMARDNNSPGWLVAASLAERIVAKHFAPLLAALQQVTAERDEARATDRESVRKRLIEAHQQLWEIDAGRDLPVKARDRNPPDTLRAVAERAVQMLEEIRAEDAAKGRPWWNHTLAKFALDDLVYALAELPDPEASLTTATSELARLRAEGEAKDRALEDLRADAAELAGVLCYVSAHDDPKALRDLCWKAGHFLENRLVGIEPHRARPRGHGKGGG